MMWKANNKIFLDSVSSTNDYLEELVNNGLQEPVVVRAGYQSEGKGYGANKWHSPKGLNLLLSFSVFPESLHPSDIFAISEIVSLSITQLISGITTKQVFVKWPNDIFVENNKIAGILIKNELEPHKVNHSIIGIGLNLNQKDFPAEIPNPVSLCRLTGEKYKPEEIQDELLTIFSSWYGHLTSGNLDHIHSGYMERLYLYNMEHTFYESGKAFTGVIKDVMPDGRLVIQTETGDRIFGFKEVKF